MASPKEVSVLTCFDVANYFIWLAKTVSGSVTHLKLQKLVYYAQGFHLALYDKPLFASEIKAWEYGPVTFFLWQKFNYYGSSPITAPDNFDISIYSKCQIALLDEVYSKFADLDPFLLVEMTHKEPTWIDAYPQKVITQEAMQRYFKVRISSDNPFKAYLLPPSDQIFEQQLDVKSDVRKSEAFQAYLASKKERSEVYRRLARS
ncbi:MAG: DUF4065 domain-containing protein [Cyanomargarita calcarea GSE-NOS-MK-12-04C]|jgi:uncharacterized phage-associated protein|uniref:DUF4065 domain-containing protein n=1 Tax=Cyanomargarita calcarea GSE-NOS-MK-12-04C TaxID=2839659 RepID=A0A951QU88_9CYAN|nr:DUF4065 domain-containing protein [Cyanomargarita calcarea GSE-NOS-MK-12-04C]